MNFKVNKGNLLIVGFLFAFLFFLDLKAEKKDNEELLAYNKDSIYEKIDGKELLQILKKETGVVVVVNQRQDINSIINDLIDLKKEEKLYVYNSKSDELILEIKNEKIAVKKESSGVYKKIIEQIGSYSDNYVIKMQEGDMIETEYKTINTPSILFINKGKILYSFSPNLEENNDYIIDIYKKGFDVLRTNN